MTLKELIQSISKDIEILDEFSKEFYGINIDYVKFKIRNHYYLLSHSKGYVYILTEQTSDGSKDISRPKIFYEIELIYCIKKLLILEN